MSLAFRRRAARHLDRPGLRRFLAALRAEGHADHVIRRDFAAGVAAFLAGVEGTPDDQGMIENESYYAAVCAAVDEELARC